MFELLEDLPPKFKKKFEKEVNMTEITRYSLQINDKAWVVVTNSNIYVLRKKWLFISMVKYRLKYIHSCKVESSKFIIASNSSGEMLQINQDRLEHVTQLAHNIQELLR